jgi:AcrR family transcriptional regulator
MAPGLRERKKQRTRQQIATAALERFSRDGFEGTSVQQICDAAEVAVSTFYSYFASKEATVFADDDERADLVAAAIREAPDHEPAHAVLRSASLELAERDSRDRTMIMRRLRLVNREPALAAYAARKQAEHIDRLTALLAERMGVDPVRDMRPRLVVSTSMAAVTAAWSAWLAQPRSDLLALVTRAHDLLDEGLTTI